MEQTDANFPEGFIYAGQLKMRCESESDVAAWMGVLSISSRRQRY